MKSGAGRCLRKPLLLLTTVVCCIFVGHIYYISLLQRVQFVPRAQLQVDPVPDPDRDKEEKIASQIRQIFKGIEEGKPLLQLYKKEGIDFGNLNEPDTRVLSESRSLGGQLPPVNGPDFRQKTIGFPTSNAPVFVADLAKSWRVADVLLTPHRVLEAIGTKNPVNDGCYRPKEPRKKWKMITLIKSWVVNKENRDALRETWTSVKQLDEVKLDAVFLVSRAPTADLQAALEAENKEFGDILQVDVEEAVEHFTERTVAGMRWVVENFESTALYSSCDDNIMANIDLLTQALNKAVAKSRTLLGRTCKLTDIFPILCVYSFREADPVPREPDNPWSIDHDTYPPDVLPGHCQGGFYTTSVATTKLLADEAVKTRLSHLDAVWITGIIRQKLGADYRSVRAAPAVSTPGDYSIFFADEIPRLLRLEWRRIVSKSKILQSIDKR